MKFYGQFDPPVDRFIFERYFSDPGIKGIFVECGAFDGVLESSCKFFEETMGWTGFNIEPVPAIYDALCRNRPNGRNLNVGLSASAGRAAFKHAIHPSLGRMFGNGAINHAPSHRKALESSGCTFEDIEIATTTWTRFVEENAIRHVDLFVLDVEGHELAVIEGMRGCAVLPDVMCVEFGHSGFDVLRDALSALGYVFDTTSHANAYFVRRDRLELFALRRGAGPKAIGRGQPRAGAGPLAFVHIPKCSGTAFENYALSHDSFATLSRAYSGVSPDRKAESVQEYLERCAASPFVFGHIPFADFPPTYGRALFATFLRDPVKRTISQYRSWHDPANFHPDDPHFLKATPEEREALLFAQSATLDEFVRTDNRIIVDGALGSLQTVHLSSRRDLSMDDQLDSARKNLREFVFFGLTERFDESIALFRRIFPDAPAYRLRQESENRSRVAAGEISPKVVEAIREQCRHDVLLHEYAQQLFEERLGAASSTRTYLLSSLAPGEAAEAAAREAALDHRRNIEELEPSHAERVAESARRLAELEAERDALVVSLTACERDRDCETAENERKLATLEQENGDLKARVEHLAASYAQLSAVYRDIVDSRTWRMLAAVQSAIARIGSK